MSAQTQDAQLDIATAKLTAWARVDLPLMVKRYALEDGDEHTCYVCDNHHDGPNLHQPVSARQTLPVHFRTSADNQSFHCPMPGGLGGHSRQARIVNHPTSFEQPQKRRVQQQPSDMRLRPVDTQRVLGRAWIQSCSLFFCHAVVGKACPKCNDHVRRYGLGGINELTRYAVSLYDHGLVLERGMTEVVQLRRTLAYRPIPGSSSLFWRPWHSIEGQQRRTRRPGGPRLR